LGSKALITTVFPVVAAFVTTRFTAEHEDSAKVRDIQELHARVSLLESRLNALAVVAEKPVGINAIHDGVAGMQDKAALNLDTNQWTPATP